MGFTSFLASDGVLGDEIGTALRGLSFLDIRTDGCARTKQLLGQYPRDSPRPLEIPSEPDYA